MNARTYILPHNTLGPAVFPSLPRRCRPSGLPPPFLAQGGDRHLRGCQLFPHLGRGPPSYFLTILSAGDSWGMLACLCTVLWHLPAVPALNRTGDPGPGPSIQKTYDLTRYLEHQLRSLAGTYVSILYTLVTWQRRSRGFGEGRAWHRGPEECWGDERSFGSTQFLHLAYLLPFPLRCSPPSWPQD